MAAVVIPKRGPKNARRGLDSRQVSRNSGLHLNVETSNTNLVLSAAASSEDILWSNRDIYIQGLRVFYPVATDANAGVAVNVGTPASAALFATFTSDVSQAINTTLDKSSLLPSTAAGRLLPAGTALRVGTAGGKTGVGALRLAVEYTFADE